MRGFYRTEETVDLGNVPEYWAAIDKAYERLTKLPETRQLSSTRITMRRADEAATAGHRVYFEAERLLSVSLDNQHALVSLLQNYGASLWAPWSLLRPQFESALMASWILDPDQSLERRKRALRCEVVDSLEQQRYIESFKDVPAMRQVLKRMRATREESTQATYRAEAETLGLPWKNEAVRKVNVVDALGTIRWIQETGEDGFSVPLYQSLWRLLSGFEHGLGWALIQGSSRNGPHTEIPGGQLASVTISDEPFVRACKFTAALLLHALRRLEELHTQPPGPRQP